MRAWVSGFSVAFGPEKAPGVPAGREEMQTVGSSEFGSTFWLKPVRAEGYQHTFHLGRHVSRAWAQAQFVGGLQLIAMSVQNIVSALRVRQGEEPSQVEFVWPSSPEAWEAPWKNRPSITEFSMGECVSFGDWTEPSREDLLRVYGLNAEPGGDGAQEV